MNKKVLIIDDEEDLGLLMKRFFLTRKIDVFVAHTIAEYPQTQLNLISALDVPKTTASSFRILEKPLLLEELTKMFG